MCLFFYYGCPQTWFVEWIYLQPTDLKRTVGMGSVEVTLPLRGYKTKPCRLGPIEFHSILLSLSVTIGQTVARRSPDMDLLTTPRREVSR